MKILANWGFEINITPTTLCPLHPVVLLTGHYSASYASLGAKDSGGHYGTTGGEPISVQMATSIPHYRAWRTGPRWLPFTQCWSACTIKQNSEILSHQRQMSSTSPLDRGLPEGAPREISRADTGRHFFFFGRHFWASLVQPAFHQWGNWGSEMKLM